VDAYRIGVSIVLANGVSPALAIIGRDLLGLNTTIKGIESNLGGWKAALIGVGAVLAGATILGAMTKIAEKAADFQDAMTKISQLNPKVAALVNSGEIQRMSFGLGSQLGMKVEDVAKVYGGIYGVLQDPKEAEELTPYAARYARLMGLRHKGSHPEESINIALRAGDLAGRLQDDKGAIDPKKVEEWFDFLAKADAATHGQFNAQTAFGLAQQAGPGAMRGLTQEGMEHMAIISQMMGGQRAGTALLSLRNQMTGSMLKRSAEALQQYGILKDGEWSSEGGHVSMNEAATKRLLGTLNRDPVAFVDMMVEELKKKGITKQEDQLLAISRMIGRQTSQREISDILVSRAQMQRETEGMEQGVTVSQGLAGYGGNIHASQQALGAAWHNLQVAIGGPEGEHFAAFLNKITAAINGITGVVGRMDPATIDTIFKVVTGIGAGLIAIGAILTGALVTTLVGFPVLIGGAIAAVVAAVLALVALDWKPLTNMLRGISSAISSFIDAIKALYGRVTGIFSGGGPVTPGDKQFKDGLDEANKNYVPMRFTPGNSAPRMQQASFSLNVDGRALAQSVIDHLESLYGMPTGAASADGVHSPFGGDHQYSSI
jgi:hypothetical protein